MYHITIPADHAVQLSRYGYTDKAGVIVLESLKSLLEFAVFLNEVTSDSFLFDKMEETMSLDGTTKLVFKDIHLM